MASTLTGKSTTAELPKLQPLLFSYISLPKYCIAFEVFVEQAVLIQKVCLSPSHYETACVAGEISRQVEQWRLEARQFPHGFTARFTWQLSKKVPAHKIPSTMQANHGKDFIYLITISSRHYLSCHFQFKYPTLGNAFCVKLPTSQA